MNNLGQRTSARRSYSIDSITHIESNQSVTAMRHAPPASPLESRSNSTPEDIQASGVTGLTPSLGLWLTFAKKHLLIAMIISLALIPLHDFGMPRTSRDLPVGWVGGIAITISILIVVSP